MELLSLPWNILGVYCYQLRIKVDPYRSRGKMDFYTNVTMLYSTSSTSTFTFTSTTTSTRDGPESLMVEWEWLDLISFLCIAWYLFILGVSIIGVLQLYKPFAYTSEET